MRICLAFCFHGFGNIKKKVVVKGFGDTHQHVCVYIWPRENLIYIAAVAVEAGGKPRGRAAFGLTVKNILYKFAYMHRLLVDLSGRFLKPYDKWRRIFSVVTVEASPNALSETDSPLPRLYRYLDPLAGEWIYDKHERSLTVLSF